MWPGYLEHYLAVCFPRFLREKPWNYKDDLCVTGAVCLAEATGDTRWIRAVKDSGRWLLKEDGRIVNWREEEHNIDKISFGRSLLTLWRVTGEKRYKAAADHVYGQLAHYPRTETGNFWHKDIYPDQVWLDGLYMAMPFYAQVLAGTGAGEEQWEDIIDQFQSTHRLLWEDALGLYVHGCDVSRKADWADPVTGRSQAVWLRAEGWYLMALADVYELALERTERAGELAALLKKGLDGILPYQDGQTKMFYQVVDQPALAGNYPETSGSAMIAYALMKGTRLKILDGWYGERGSEILDGICATYLKREEGICHLYGICASAGLGVGPDPHNRKDRTGKPEYYVGEARMADNQHGAAACMMAFSEQIRRSRSVVTVQIP